MAIDMTQFYQVFFDEADEHLAQMESLLVALDLTAPDMEDVNAIFRAAHSIKGSSGTFGFDDMMEITHVMETLLDKVRKGELALDTERVDACLRAGDVLRTLLGAHRGGQAADPAAAALIRDRLNALCAGEGAPAAASATPLVAPPAVSAPASPDDAEMRSLEVRFVPEPHVAGQRELMSNMLEELARLGSVEVLEEPPPDAQYGQWRLAMCTRLSEADLRGVIDFMAEPRSVVILARSDAAAAPPASATAEAAYGFFAPRPAAAEAEVEVEAVDEEAAFGFFAPLPAVAPPAVPAEPADAASAPAKVKADSSIRVSVEKVDQLINMVGELVITQSMLQQSASQINPVLFESLMSSLVQLERNTRDLQESVMSIRMMPISAVFSRFPRVVRDLSQKLGKQVELKTRGETTELDRGLIERVADPLTHLVRNSLDHGIESPEARRAAGKAESGTITLAAAHKGGSVVIEVSDDGAGLDRARILATARERGIVAPDSLSDAEVWALIFDAGFSTAKEVTEVSGRGVGMDVVKKNIAAMGGRVEIESMLGVGTRITVRLPLTLAILDGMSVRVGGETYILPLNYVVESLQVTRDMVHSISGADRLIRLRGEFISVVPLGTRFGVAQAQTDWCAGIMVVVEADGLKAALFVDELGGQHQVVIKSLQANFRRVDGVSGATIMGDGQVAMILDAPSLVSGARRRLQSVA